jgi:hypothetical protein
MSSGLREAFPHEKILLDHRQTACEAKPLPLFTVQKGPWLTFSKGQRFPAQNHPNSLALQKTPLSIFDPSDEFEEEKARSPRIQCLAQ